MIFGHIAATAVCGKVVFKRYYSLPILLGLAFLPDLLDKNLYLVFGLLSRGYFHSLVAALFFFCAVASLSRLFPGRLAKTAALEVGFLYLAHLACDVIPLKLLFWPLDFSGVFPGINTRPLFAGKFNMLEILDRFYFKIEYPVWLAAEIAFLLAYAVILARSFSLGELPGPRWFFGRWDFNSSAYGRVTEKVAE